SIEVWDAMKTNGSETTVTAVNNATERRYLTLALDCVEIEDMLKAIRSNIARLKRGPVPGGRTLRPESSELLADARYLVSVAQKIRDDIHGSTSPSDQAF